MGLPFQGKHRAGNFVQAHPGNVPGGHPQGVAGFRGVEIPNLLKILILQVIARVYPAAGQQHGCHAASHQGAELERQVVIVQLFQQAPLGELFQLTQVVAHVVLHGVSGGGEQGVPKILPVFQLPEAVFQGLCHILLILGTHLPQGHGPGHPGFVGVGHVKVVPQPVGTLPVKHGDALGSPVDPPPKPLVPPLHLQNGGGVWPLGVDQKLLVKGQTVIAAGGGEKRPPASGGSGHLTGGLLK